MTEKTTSAKAPQKSTQDVKATKTPTVKKSADAEAKNKARREKYAKEKAAKSAATKTAVEKVAKAESKKAPVLKPEWLFERTGRYSMGTLAYRQLIRKYNELNGTKYNEWRVPYPKFLEIFACVTEHYGKGGTS
jgi:hypothetical protein